VEHEAKTTVINYYDSNPETSEMNDAYHTLFSFEGPFIKPLTQGNPVINRIGSLYSFKINSFWARNEAKNNGNDRFYLRIVTDNPSGQQEEPYRSTYLGFSGNEYRIEYLVKYMSSTQLWLSTACQGVRVKYFSD